MMKTVLDIVTCPYLWVGRGVWAIIVILYLNGVITMGMIDVTNYGIPDDYLVPMFIAVFVMGLLTAIGIRRYYHDKAADKKIEAGEIKTVYDLPYDKRYDFGTIVGFILGAAAGMYMAPAIVDYVFIGAGMYIYALVAGLGAALMVVIITTLVHFGLRKWVVKAKKYITETAGAINDLKGTVQDVLDDGKVNGSAGAETAEPQVIAMGQTVQKP